MAVLFSPSLGPLLPLAAAPLPSTRASWRSSPAAPSQEGWEERKQSKGVTRWPARDGGSTDRPGLEALDPNG